MAGAARYPVTNWMNYTGSFPPAYEAYRRRLDESENRRIEAVVGVMAQDVTPADLVEDGLRRLGQPLEARMCLRFVWRQLEIRAMAALEVQQVAQP